MVKKGISQWGEINYEEAYGVFHKLRLQEEGGRWSKKLTFCKLSYHRKRKWRRVGGQKKSNFVNVVCELLVWATAFYFLNNQ